MRRRRRPTMMLRPVLDRFESKTMASAGLLGAHLAKLTPRLASSHLGRHGHGKGHAPTPTPTPTPTSTTTPPRSPTPTPSSPVVVVQIPQTNGTTSYTLGPDSGPLVPPFAQYPASSFAPVPGVVYNLLTLTVRNGTSRTFGAGSGLSVGVTGQGGPQTFPQGAGQWKPGQVLVLYAFTDARFPTSFTFNLNGSTRQEPANLSYGIQYYPSSFPGLLNSIAARSVGARYQMS